MALDMEIQNWNGFARALRRDDREAFDELMGMCSCFAMASSNATNPIILEPMIMSMLLAQQERIRTLEKKLSTIKPVKSNSSVTPELLTESHPAVDKSLEQDPVGGDQTRLS
jgi:hypothetical protein